MVIENNNLRIHNPKRGIPFGIKLKNINLNIFHQIQFHVHLIIQLTPL